MLDTGQNVAIVIICLACSLSFMAAVNYYWPPEHRRAHNDLIGWQLSVVGTTYAVILGFMLYTVWINFGTADLNSDAEANSVMNLYRLANGLPAEQGTQIRILARKYADVVVQKEWPEMAREISPTESLEVTREIWKTLTSAKGSTPNEITAEDHALYELSALSGYRRVRMVESANTIPGILWFVLITGGIVTIASSCLFGAANGVLHFIQVAAFSLLIALVLVAVADINRPFQGSVHVSDYAFRQAQIDMQSE